MWPFKRKDWDKNCVIVSSAQLRAELKEKFGIEKPLVRDGALACNSDKDFDELIWIARPQPHDEIKYLADIFDCDDFADCFIADLKRAWAKRSKGKRPLAFGYMQAVDPQGIMHAFIWRRNNKGEYVFYESQINRRLRWEPKAAAQVWQ